MGLFLAGDGTARENWVLLVAPVCTSDVGMRCGHMHSDVGPTVMWARALPGQSAALHGSDCTGNSH